MTATERDCRNGPSGSQVARRLGGDPCAAIFAELLDQQDLNGQEWGMHGALPTVNVAGFPVAAFHPDGAVEIELDEDAVSQRMGYFVRAVAGVKVNRNREVLIATFPNGEARRYRRGLVVAPDGSPGALRIPDERALLDALDRGRVHVEGMVNAARDGIFRGSENGWHLDRIAERAKRIADRIRGAGDGTGSLSERKRAFMEGMRLLERRYGIAVRTAEEYPELEAIRESPDAA